MKDLKYINSKLHEHFKELIPKNDLYEVLEYALFPPGKLFRPELIYALASDLDSLTKNHEYFASAIETHHAYTLVHDDLPAMDNDDFRRGKPSTHKKYGQWKAILAGDALLSLSYGLLSKIETKPNELLRLFHESTGAAGLIFGQYLDLESAPKNIDDIIQIHTLKTARLIQLSLSGSNILSGNSALPKELIEELGLNIGIVFQLIDDLTELTEEINEHEREINPFLNFASIELYSTINNCLENIYRTLDENTLTNLNDICERYLNKMKSKINDGEEKIKTYIHDFDKELLKFK